MQGQGIGRRLRGSFSALVGWARHERWMLFVFGLAFVIRAVYVAPQARIPQINDMGVYDQLATNLISGNGYISKLEPHFRSWRAPGYPFFLGAIYWLFGHRPLVVLLLQSLLGALTCACIYWIGREYLEHRIGLIAGLICAVDPEMIHWTAKMLTETLFVFLLVLLVLLCLKLTRPKGWGTTVGAGLVLGYATLVRPNILLFVPFLLLFLLVFVQAPMRKRIMLCILVSVIGAFVVLPWTVRNYVVHGRLVPVSTMGGVSLFVGVPPPPQMMTAAGYEVMAGWEYVEAGMHMLPNGYDMLPELLGRAPTSSLPDNFDELEQSRQGTRYFLDYVRADPVRYGKLLLTKLSLAFGVVPKQYSAEIGEGYGFGRFDRFVRLYQMVFLVVTFAIGPLGLISLSRRRMPTALLASVVLYHVVLLIVFRPALRYFLPGLVIGSLFTAEGMETLFALRSLLREQRARTVRWLAIWSGFLVLHGVNIVYQVFVLRWDMVVHSWDRLVRVFS